MHRLADGAGQPGVQGPPLRSVDHLIADKPQVELVPREEGMCEESNLDFGDRNGKNKWNASVKQQIN